MGLKEKEFYDFAKARTFGRLKGRRLTKNQEFGLKQLLSNMSFDTVKGADFIKKKCWVEIGFGNGEHLIHQANERREINFVGCEVFLNGVASTCFNAYKSKLKNIKIFNGDTRILFKFLPKESIERYYILFPDPWPKKRHRRRRLVNWENIESICFSLKKGGKICIATDVLDYKDQIIELFKQMKIFRRIKFNPFEKNHRWFANRNTKYEEKAIKEGRKPFYLVYSKI